MGWKRSFRWGPNSAFKGLGFFGLPSVARRVVAVPRINPICLAFAIVFQLPKRGFGFQVIHGKRAGIKRVLAVAGTGDNGNNLVPGAHFANAVKDRQAV